MVSAGRDRDITDLLMTDREAANSLSKFEQVSLNPCGFGLQMLPESHRRTHPRTEPRIDEAASRPVGVVLNRTKAPPPLMPAARPLAAPAAAPPPRRSPSPTDMPPENRSQSAPASSTTPLEPHRWLEDLAAAARGLEMTGGNDVDGEVRAALNTLPGKRSASELSVLAAWLERAATISPAVMKHLSIEALCRTMVLRPPVGDGTLLRYQGERSEALMIVLSGKANEYGVGDDPAALAIQFGPGSTSGGAAAEVPNAGASATSVAGSASGSGELGGSSGGGSSGGGSSGASGGVPTPEVERSVMLAQLSRFRHKEAAKAGTPAARISTLVQKPPAAWRQLLGELRWKEERRKRQQPVKPATSVSDVVAVKRISRGILLPEKKRREKAAAVRRV